MGNRLDWHNQCHKIDDVFLAAFDALGLDAEYADYDMDSDDEEFIKKFDEVGF